MKVYVCHLIEASRFIALFCAQSESRTLKITIFLCWAVSCLQAGRAQKVLGTPTGLWHVDCGYVLNECDFVLEATVCSQRHRAGHSWTCAFASRLLWSLSPRSTASPKFPSQISAPVDQQARRATSLLPQESTMKPLVNARKAQYVNY